MPSKTNPMTPEVANAIFDVLVEYADAPARLREDFVTSQIADDICTEYRFKGSLGFGGKFWREGHGNDTWRVDAYPEDEKRHIVAKTIASTNIALAALQAEKWGA